jgi:cardiolipin synthase A/B
VEDVGSFTDDCGIRSESMKSYAPNQLRTGHSVHLLQGGKEFFSALTQAIESARLEIRIETYILNIDASGERILKALASASERGVAVYLVMDGVGTPELPSDWAQRLTQAGVKWRIFLPLGRVGLLIPSRWRRLHRKLCVIDGRIAFCGGINLLDDLLDPNHGALSAPRFDFAVRVSGPLVQQVHAALTRFWWRMQTLKDLRRVDLASVWADLHRGTAPSVDMPEQPSATHSGAKAMLLLRDNLLNRGVIERAYRRAIGRAKDEIIIANAYFLPGRKLRLALIHAARRGVRVQLLLQGRYEYFIQHHAAKLVYGELLAAGVSIHEYEASFLHAKVAVIDSTWATVGSSNLDPLSLLLAREANVVVANAVFAQDLRRRLLYATEKEGKWVNPEDHARRPWQQRVLNRMAFALMRTALFLTGNRY